MDFKKLKINSSNLFKLMFILMVIISTTISTGVIYNHFTNTNLNSPRQTVINSQSADSFQKIFALNSSRNFNISFTNYTSLFVQQLINHSPNLNQDYPQSWTSTTTYANDGFLTVGGDGIIYFKNNTFFAPSHMKNGFYTGSSWDGNNFLVVGQNYAPHDGVLMGLYSPSTNSLIDKTSLFDSSLSANATLYDATWNGTSFLILGSHLTNKNQSLMLYNYNPNSNILTNMTALLPHSFDSFKMIDSVSMKQTPKGTYFLIMANGITRLGALVNNTVIDLTNYIPSKSNINSYDPRVVKNTMVWINNTLFIGLSFDNNSMVLFNYNPMNKSEIVYYNQFASINGLICSLSYLDNYFFITGYSFNNLPFVYALKLNGTIINVLASLPSQLSQTKYFIDSTATNGISHIYITYGINPIVYYGSINIITSNNSISISNAITQIDKMPNFSNGSPSLNNYTNTLLIVTILITILSVLSVSYYIYYLKKKKINKDSINDNLGINSIERNLIIYLYGRLTIIFQKLANDEVLTNKLYLADKIDLKNKSDYQSTDLFVFDNKINKINFLSILILIQLAESIPSPMTLTDLVSSLNKNKSTLSDHLSKLKDSNFIKEKVLIEKGYDGRLKPFTITINGLSFLRYLKIKISQALGEIS